jgi:hypothetical protein
MAMKGEHQALRDTHTMFVSPVIFTLYECNAWLQYYPGFPILTNNRDERMCKMKNISLDFVDIGDGRPMNR